MTPHDIDKATLLVAETRKLTERWYEILVYEGGRIGAVGSLIVHMVRCMDEMANAVEQLSALVAELSGSEGGGSE